MANLGKLTARQQAHYGYMADVMRRLEWDLHNTIELTGRIPPEWQEIAQSTPERAKVNVTLGIEEDVLRFFKSMGKGHGPRINAVLKSYMHARLAGVIRGAETISHYRRRQDGFGGTKPAFGETGAMEGAPWPEEAEAPPDARRARLREGLQKFYADRGEVPD